MNWLFSISKEMKNFVIVSFIKMVKVLVSFGSVAVCYGENRRVVFDGVSNGSLGEQIASEMVNMDEEEINQLIDSNLTIVITPTDLEEVAFGHRVLLRRRYKHMDRFQLELELDMMVNLLASSQMGIGSSIDTMEGVIKTRVGDINRRETQIELLERGIDARLEPRLVLESQD